MTELVTETVEDNNEAIEMENLDDFLKQEKLRMHVLIAHENPYRPRQTQEGALHWSCKLIHPARELWIVVYFSKGLGIRSWNEPPQGLLSEGTPFHVPKNKIGTRYDGPMPPFETDKDKETFERCSVPEPPSLREVMRCLAIDLRNVETAGGFEKWAVAMESTPDSITARAAFDTIVKQRGEMMQLLGEEPYHRLLYETELK